MSKNSISFDDVKDMILAFAKEHPGWTAIGAGVGFGIAFSVPKLAPTIETCWKYSVDKVVDRLPKATTPPVLAEETIIEASVTDLPNESNAA